MTSPATHLLPSLLFPLGPFLPQFEFPHLDAVDLEHENSAQRRHRLAIEAALEGSGHVVAVTLASQQDLMEALRQLGKADRVESRWVEDEEIFRIGTLVEVKRVEEAGNSQVQLRGVKRVVVRRRIRGADFTQVEFSDFQETNSNPALTESLVARARELFEAYLQISDKTFGLDWMADPIRNESDPAALLDRLTVYCGDGGSHLAILAAVSLCERAKLVVQGLEILVSKRKGVSDERQGEKRRFQIALEAAGYEIAETLDESEFLGTGGYLCRSRTNIGDRPVARVRYRRGSESEDEFRRIAERARQYQYINTSHFRHLRAVLEGDTWTALIRDEVTAKNLGEFCVANSKCTIAEVLTVVSEICAVTIALGRNGIADMVLSADEILIAPDLTLFVSPPSYELLGDTEYGSTLGPEVLATNKADVRSDVYTLGALAYLLLTGEPPFGRGIKAIFAASKGESPSDITLFRDDCPTHLTAAVMRSLSANPEDRFQTVEEFQSVIQS